ncbi:MAG: hypothetical protein RLZZ28_2201 [Bacteroidota bacterium]
MAKLKISSMSKMLFLSISFTMGLLFIRFMVAHTFDYRFYGWNTFLAAIPYAISTLLIKCKKWNFSTCLLLLFWLLFFPNAPYLITDLLHYEERPPIPFWYDILLVISATWNGLILGFASLWNIEIFLSRFIRPLFVQLAVCTGLLLCSYGVFLGRFLRFNSWDIISDPAYLAYTSAHHVLLPQRYPKIWVFTFLFALLLMLMYTTLKQFAKMAGKEKIGS